MVNEWGDRAQADFKQIYSNLYHSYNEEKRKKLLDLNDALTIIENKFYPCLQDIDRLCDYAQDVIKDISKKTPNIISKDTYTYAIGMCKECPDLYTLYHGIYRNQKINSLHVLTNKFDEIIYSSISDTFFFTDYDQARFIGDLSMKVYKHFLPYQKGDNTYVDQ